MGMMIDIEMRLRPWPWVTLTSIAGPIGPTRYDASEIVVIGPWRNDGTVMINRYGTMLYVAESPEDVERMIRDAREVSP